VVVVVSATVSSTWTSSPLVQLASATAAIAEIARATVDRRRGDLITAAQRRRGTAHLLVIGAPAPANVGARRGTATYDFRIIITEIVPPSVAATLANALVTAQHPPAADGVL
jgi:hypothetical protein